MSVAAQTGRRGSPATAHGGAVQAAPECGVAALPSADQILGRKNGALVSELAAAWGIGGRGAANRIEREMAACRMFRGLRMVNNAKRYFSSAALRDAWLETGARELDSPLQAKAMEMVADGREYLTSPELAKAFNATSMNASNALTRLAERGSITRVIVGRRSFYFPSREAADKYPPGKLAQRMEQMVRADAKRKKPMPEAKPAKPPKKPPTSKLSGESQGLDSAKRSFTAAPKSPLEVDDSYRGPFSTRGKYIPGIDPMTGKPWGAPA